jgi:hypothetical protein
METSFRLGPKQHYPECVLLYKLQRKQTDGTGNQLDSSTASIKDATANTYLLVICDDGWKLVNYGFYVYLIGCTDDFTWDEDKLWIFYKGYKEKFYKNHKDNIITWLMNDGTLLKTKFDITYGSDYKIDIVISEGTGKYDMEEPRKIDPKRLVLPLSVLIMLMNAVRLRIRPSVKLDIHNQCLSVDLISPTYFTDCDLECHRPPDYEVCAGNITRSGFISRAGNEFYAILIYKLQRRQLRESAETSEDTSDAAHLLVIWKYKSKKLRADVLVVKYEKDFIWNKDNLEKLYDKNIYSSRLHPGSATETWSLDDSTTLMTTSNVMNEGLIVDITVSEVERCHSTRTPIHIDLKR